MTLPDNVCIFIMAGGSGERFWPMSRKTRPKQLLKLFSDDSLLGETVNRVRDLVSSDQLFLLTNQAQIEPTRSVLPDFPAGQMIGEPAKRDTAPAAALATGWAHSQSPDTVVILLPADQLIKDITAFQRNLRDVASRAATGHSLLTLAIHPTFASTGFGYLELEETSTTGPEGTQCFPVKRFVEKPDAATAQQYLDSGRFAWNAGMFAWKASAFLEVARNHQPELARFIEGFPTGERTRYLENEFTNLPKISVDYAIMEKAESVEAARAEFDWDDVGAWTALPKHLGQDSAGNSRRGAATLRDARNNILVSTGRHLAVSGVDNLVVVETEDAVLVCHRDKVQEIKKLLPDLPSELC